MLERKQHEEQLRAFQLDTASRFIHLRPPESLVRQLAGPRLTPSSVRSYRPELRVTKAGIVVNLPTEGGGTIEFGNWSSLRQQPPPQLLLHASALEAEYVRLMSIMRQA